MNEILTQGELIDKLYEEISRQNTSYLTIISVVVGAILVIAFAYTIQQLKFSDKGIERMKRDIYKEFEIDNIKVNIEKSDKNNTKAENNIKTLQKQLDDFKEFKKENISMLLDVFSEQFSLTAEYAEEIVLNNELQSIKNVIDKYKGEHIGFEDFMSFVANFHNGLIDIQKRKFVLEHYKREIKNNIKDIDEYIIDKMENTKGIKKIYSNKKDFIETFKKTDKKIQQM